MVSIDYDYVAADRRSDEKKMQMVGGDGALLEAVVSETFRNHLNSTLHSTHSIHVLFFFSSSLI
jgi:hypothetical protein